jgi:AraC-like DNA-binding protein
LVFCFDNLWTLLTHFGSPSTDGGRASAEKFRRMGESANTLNSAPERIAQALQDEASCGAHVPVRWSSFCAVYRYEPGPESAQCGGDKIFELTIIDQQVSGCWEFRGDKGRSLVQPGMVLAGSRGVHFGCRHTRGQIERSNIIALRPGAISDGEQPLFSRQVLAGLPILDLRRALSIEADEDFDSFVFEIFNRVSQASLGNCGPRKPNIRSERIKRFIEQHAFENLSLAPIAACAGLSPFSCIRQFREATGMTPLRYLSRIRLDRARKLLSTSRLTIGEIASQVGIRDRFYFTRWFSKETGISPKEFRDRANP